MSSLAQPCSCVFDLCVFMYVFMYVSMYVWAHWLSLAAASLNSSRFPILSRLLRSVPSRTAIDRISSTCPHVLACMHVSNVCAHACV